MDSILHYSSVGHAGSLMATVNQMRVCADLCDITVVVGQYRILAHKIILSASSPFFYQMLKTDARPELSNLKEVLLDSVNEIAALKIIEFCYTSAISLDDDTVWPLLEAAIKFQFTEICSLCCEFLTAGLDVSNCIPSLRLAAKLQFSQLEENCVKFLTDNCCKASQSGALVNSTAQDLATVLSVLDAHNTPAKITASLAQAWLDFDSDSRADFVPKLKLLLPLLSDLISNNFHAGQSSLAVTDILAPHSKGQRLNMESPDSQQVSADTNVRSPQASGAGGSSQSSSFLPSTGSKSRQSPSSPARAAEDFPGSAKDFICVSCGDEFVCHSDLVTHGRLCHESARLLKTADRNDGANTSPSADLSLEESKKSESITSSSLDESREREGVDALQNDESNLNRVESKSEVSEEPSYPKTRRSLRNRKLDVTSIQMGIKTSTVHNGSTSLPVQGQRKEENDKSQSKLAVEKGGGEEKNSTKQGDTEELKADGGLSDDHQGECPEGEGKGHAIQEESADQSDLTVSREAMSINDNNNNDVGQDSSSIDQSTSLTVKGDSRAVESLGGGLTQTHTPFKQTAADLREGKTREENGHEVNSGRDDLDESGSSPLRQWRQEHQNSTPDVSFPLPSPSFKCLICSRGFWDRKVLANHWRQNHGVRSMANEDEEFSCSDHESDPRSSDMSSKQTRQSPNFGFFHSQNIPPVTGCSGLNSDASTVMQKNADARTFATNTTRQTSGEISVSRFDKRLLGMNKVKEELIEGKGDSVQMESFDKQGNYSDDVHRSRSKADEENRPQTMSTQCPTERFKGDAMQALNPSFDHWKKGVIWAHENSENTAGGTDAATPASQGLNPTSSEFFTDYLNQYNKLAEWYMSQGAHYCSDCLAYHAIGKQCPKSATANSNETSTAGSQGEVTPKDKESKGVKPSKREDEEEGPLDMSKSSADFSFGQMTPSSSGSSSKSSSVNSSGHSSILGGASFFNYGGHLLSESNALDMSTPRFSDGKLMAPLAAGNSLAMPLSRKSPLDPTASFGTPFATYQPQFSTATSLSSPSAGPSNGKLPNSSNAPTMPSLPKSSTPARKKVTSRQGFPCTVCNRVFSYQTALFTHMHTHSPSARSYRCQLCNETFARAPDLKVHVCPNGMEKPYSCPSCGQTFAKNIHLKRHLATHSGLKPYPCWVCGKRFSRSDHLKRHTQSIHAGARPHVCQVCGKEFVRKYELNKHMQSHEQQQMFVVS